jgi:hypothetical protein
VIRGILIGIQETPTGKAVIKGMTGIGGILIESHKEMGVSLTGVPIVNQEIPIGILIGIHIENET